MRSRASRLFGSSAASKGSVRPQTTRPSRTLTLSSPTIIPEYDETSPDLADTFGDFDFGVQQLADSLSYPEDHSAQPLFDQLYKQSAPVSSASDAFRWSVQSAGQMQEIEEGDESHDLQGGQDSYDDYTPDESLRFDEHGQRLDSYDADGDNEMSDVEEDLGHETITAARISFFSVGKPILIDIITRSNSVTSTRTSSYTARTSSCSYAVYDSDKPSHTSTSSSSISEQGGMVPSPKHYNSKPFARRKHERTLTSSSTSSQKLGKVEEISYAPSSYLRYSKEDARSKLPYYVETAEIIPSPGSRTPSSLTSKKSISNLLFKH